ncbi:hypothetical protein GN956_G25402 [Arapaima gigas]
MVSTYCTVVKHCVNTGYKMVFGSGTKVTVESGKCSLVYFYIVII